MAQPSLVSLFAGAGGLDIGLERAGWKTTLATDIDAECVRTLAASKQAGIRVEGRSDTYLERARVFAADIRDLTGADLRPKGVRRDWRPSLLAGGPPCQPWSSAGHQKGFADPRGVIVQHYVRLADELRPRFIVFENVRGLLTALGPCGRPGEALRAIQDALEEIGYATRVALINAADYGAAQRRVRLFLVATADHELPDFPEPSHAREAVPGRLRWVSLGEALASLPSPRPEDVVRPTGERADELRSLEPGTGIRTGGRVEANRPGGHWGYRQDSFLADPSLPGRTIRTAATPDWIREASGDLRRLTWRECAALQGFPADWQFSGPTAARFRQIGNAVQTDVGRAIGNAILRSLKKGPAPCPPVSAPWPDEFHRRVRYTEAEHRVNGEYRVRVKATL